MTQATAQEGRPRGLRALLSSPALRRSASDRTESLVFAAMLIGLASAPLWFGGDRLIVWGVNAAYYGLLCVIHEIGLLLSGAPRQIHLRRIAAPALLMAIVIIWIFAQATFPFAHPIWPMAAEALGGEPAGVISVSPDQTFLALLRLVTALLMFWLVLQTCRRAKRARRLVEAIALIGMFYALYGFIAFYAFPNTTLWFDKANYQDALTSTFLSRSSYATYAGMGLVCALALSFAQLVRPTGGDWRHRTGRVIESLAGAGGFWLGGSVLLGVALILTGSRGGVAASVAGLIVLILMASLRGRKNAGMLGPALVLTFVTIGGVFFAFGDFFADRVVAYGLRSEDRFAVYQITLLSIQDLPLTGFGYGSFAQIFPMYRDDSIGSLAEWGRARNTYLEAIQGLGAPMALAFVTAIAWVAGRCLTASLQRSQAATAPLAATAASVVIGLHAFVDFSLQIQSVSLTWVALLAAGTAQSWSSQIATGE